MTTVDLVAELKRKGFTLRLRGESALSVIPASKLTEPLRNLIREHRAEIVGLLRGASGARPTPFPQLAELSVEEQEAYEERACKNVR